MTNLIFFPGVTELEAPRVTAPKVRKMPKRCGWCGQARHRKSESAGNCARRLAMLNTLPSK